MDTEDILIYVTFKNNSVGAKMIVTVQNQKHIINPETELMLKRTVLI